MWRGQQYRSVLAPFQHDSIPATGSDGILTFHDDSDTDSTSSDGTPRQPKLTEGLELYPTNSFPGSKLEWQVESKGSHLEVSISIPNFPTLPRRNPMDALIRAASSVFVPCTHDHTASYVLRIGNIYVTSPLHPRPKSRDPTRYGIVQSDKNEAVRFLTLAGQFEGIIRMDSCLECCIKCCELLPRQFIVT